MAKYNKEAFMMSGGVEEIADLFAEKKASDKIFEEELKKRGGNTVVELDIDDIVPNPQNRFKPIDGKSWDEFVGSVSARGVIIPIITRPKGEAYEIIAGHNRVRAAKEVGLKTVPSIVIDVNDVESTVIMGLTNKQREGTSDIEWGWAYRNTYEALKRPAANQYTKSAGSHDGNQQKTIDIVAQKYGVSKNSIHRKMRLTYLLEPLQKMYEDKKLSQEIAVELSYVSEEQLSLIHI